MNSGEELIHEINTVIASGAVNSGTEGDAALPFESLDDFSTDPVGFAEMSKRMLEKTELLFDLSAKYNRHSGDYLKICAFLEKGIKYLAGCFLTKIALERHNYSFPELGQLSTDKLYRMASFNFRKLDTALSEDIAKSGNITPELIGMELCYFNLLQRLRSTEVRIYHDIMKLRDGREDFSPFVHGTAFSEKSTVRKTTVKHCDPPSFRKAPAFSPMKDVIRAEAGLPAPAAGQNLIKTTDLFSDTLKNRSEFFDPDARLITAPEGQLFPPEPAPFGNNSLKENISIMEDALNNIKKNDFRKEESGSEYPETDGKKKKGLTQNTLDREFDENLRKVWARFKGGNGQGSAGNSPP